LAGAAVGDGEAAGPQAVSMSSAATGRRQKRGDIDNPLLRERTTIRFTSN
jgi:hypothetical protein